MDLAKEKTPKASSLRPSKIPTIIILAIIIPSLIIIVVYICFGTYRLRYRDKRLETPVDPIFIVSESAEGIRGTTKMVNKIYYEVKEKVDSLGEKTREDAVWYIIQHRDDFFENDEIMENLMCYGWILEYGSPNETASKMGMQVGMVVKYMYRGYETLDSEYTQNKLKRIDEYIDEILDTYDLFQ